MSGRKKGKDSHIKIQLDQINSINQILRENLNEIQLADSGLFLGRLYYYYYHYY